MFYCAGIFMRPVLAIAALVLLLRIILSTKYGTIKGNAITTKTKNATGEIKTNDAEIDTCLAANDTIRSRVSLF